MCCVWTVFLFCVCGVCVFCVCVGVSGVCVCGVWVRVFVCVRVCAYGMSV